MSYFPNPSEEVEKIMVDSTDFRRLETKVDKLTDAMNKLVLVEERQTNQGQRIGELEKENAVLRARIEATDKKLDQWVNRGIGVWACAIVIYSILQFFHK